MSLIEHAIAKAKQFAETGTHLKPTPAPAPTERQQRVHRPGPDAAELTGRTAQARPLPQAPIDNTAMERSGVLLQMDDTAALRSYRILRTRVQQRMIAEGWNTIAVTAAGAAEGKTLTAINLAISLARDVNTWVCLVDLDLQRPKLASYLGMQFDKGLSDYFAGTASFDEIVYGIGVDRLGIVPNAQSLEHASDLLDSPRARDLFESLAREQPRHIVIFDMPPLLMSDDVIKFSPNVDCVLLVVSEGGASRASMQRADEVTKGMNLLGVVLNRSAEREESGYY
jgi:protein-tyrosine kinase